MIFVFMLARIVEGMSAHSVWPAVSPPEICGPPAMVADMLLVRDWRTSVLYSRASSITMVAPAYLSVPSSLASR